MSSNDVIPFLIRKTSDEKISAAEMARRIGISETNWSHARRGLRGLTVKQIERAIALYPEIRDMLGSETEPERVPA